MRLSVLTLASDILEVGALHDMSQASLWDFESYTSANATASPEVTIAAAIPDSGRSSIAQQGTHPAGDWDDSFSSNL